MPPPEVGPKSLGSVVHIFIFIWPGPHPSVRRKTDHAPRPDRRRCAERLLRGRQSRGGRGCRRGRRDHRADRAGPRRIPPRRGDPRPPHRPRWPLRRQPRLPALLARALRGRHGGGRVPSELRSGGRLRRDRRGLRQGGVRGGLQRVRGRRRERGHAGRLAAGAGDRRGGCGRHRDRPLREGDRPGRGSGGVPYAGAAGSDGRGGGGDDGAGAGGVARGGGEENQSPGFTRPGPATPRRASHAGRASPRPSPTPGSPQA